MGENCDNGPQDGDGCTSSCVVERHFGCTRVIGQPSVCTPLYACGNNKFEPYNFEQCDTKSEGCVDCQFVAGWICTSKVGQESICNRIPIENPAITCGDGKVSTGEQCDDGNLASNDGCSSTCMIEAGWKCSSMAAGSLCQPLPPHCENGKYEPSLGEQCDNFFSVEEDGCSKDCTVTQGWSCPFNIPLSKSGCIKNPAS